MKKLISVIIVSVFVSVTPVYSQIGGLLNKAKKENNKSKQSETTPTQTKKETSTGKKETTESVGAKQNTNEVTAKFSDVKTGMVDATLEQQAIKIVNEKAVNENWKEKYSKAKIISTDWEIEKDEFEKIVCRKIYMKLYGVWPDGKCKAVEFGFKQNYTDNGKYLKTLMYNGIGDMELLICE